MRALVRQLRVLGRRRPLRAGHGRARDRGGGGGGRGRRRRGALVLAGAAAHGDVPEGSALRPVAAARLAEVAWLLEAVVVVVAELGVGGVAPRAVERLLLLRPRAPLGATRACQRRRRRATTAQGTARCRRRRVRIIGALARIRGARVGRHQHLLHGLHQP